VQARIAVLNAQTERITESYDAARDKLAQLRAQQKVAALELGRDRNRLSGAQSQLAATANLVYRTGGIDPFMAIVTSDSAESFLEQATTLDELSRSQAQQLADLATANHDVAAAQANVSARALAAQQVLASIAQQRSRIQGLLAQERTLLDSLRAADRARLDAAAAHEATSMAALRGSYNGPASGRAAVAVRFAYAQLGKPYSYGAAGPDAYDCSGLTMQAWAAAGVSLPHNAAAQQSSVRPVSYANLPPGDLVFFGSPAYHVGIYVGNGNFIHAPHTGDVVRIAALSSEGGFAGGGRP
jgi:cell wall-associated NlpC family hydrolase